MTEIPVSPSVGSSSQIDHSRYASGATQIVSEDSSNPFQFLVEDLNPTINISSVPMPPMPWAPHMARWKVSKHSGMNKSWTIMDKCPARRAKQLVDNPLVWNLYTPDNRGWLMHADLGWLFAYGQPGQGVWLWREGLGWVWKHPNHYIYVQ